LIDHIYTSAGGFGNIKGGPDLGRVAISKDGSLLTNLMISSSHLSQQWLSMVLLSVQKLVPSTKFPSFNGSFVRNDSGGNNTH